MVFIQKAFIEKAVLNFDSTQSELILVLRVVDIMMNEKEWYKYYSRFPGWVDEEAVYSGWRIQRFWQKQKINEIKKRLIKGKTLDVGCGSGVLCREISGKNFIVGIDISKNAIKYCNSRKKEGEFYVVASAFHLPFKKNAFNDVICSEVIEHISNPKKVLSEINSCLTKGGKQIITTPNYGFSLWVAYELLWDLFGKGRNYRFQHISKFNIKKLKRLIPNIKSIYSIFILSPLFSFLSGNVAKRVMKFELKTMKNNGCLIIAESEK